jgi:hypothetical protein
MAKRTDLSEMVVRLPSDVKGWIEQEAERNCASQNSEIIRSVRARMDTEQQQPKRAAG